MAAGEGGALGDAAVGGGEGDQVHAVEFVAQVAPGVAGGVSATRMRSSASQHNWTWARMRSSRWW